MAEKHLGSIILENQEKIKFPETSTHYRCKSGEIRFFEVNPTPQKSMKERPRNAKYIEYPDYHNHEQAGWHEYGDPIFYDEEGNILKQ